MLPVNNNATIKVTLPYVDLTHQVHTNLQPQAVTSTDPLSAWIYLSNLGLPVGTPANNCIVSAGGQVIIKQCSRLIPIAFGFHSVTIPNVNPRNNTLVLHSDVSGDDYTLTITEGYYTTSLALITEIETQLNSVTGLSGLTFTATLLGGIPDLYELAAVGGTFYIDPTCTAVTKGMICYGIPVSSVSTTSIVVGPMFLFYTAYIDVHSLTLTKYAKVRSISTSNAKSGIFERYFVFTPIISNGFQGPANNRTNVINYNSQETVNSVDIQLYDMFGDPLYLPAPLQDKCIWTLTFAAQM